MELTLIDGPAAPLLEGPAGQPLLERPADTSELIGECLGYSARGLLLYAANLPPGFFELRSGVAGELLQKLRNYQVRLALVVPPDRELSERFREMVRDERRGSEFAVVADRAAALDWLEHG